MKHNCLTTPTWSSMAASSLAATVLRTSVTIYNGKSCNFPNKVESTVGRFKDKYTQSECAGGGNRYAKVHLGNLQ